VAGPHAILAPLVFPEFLGADVEVSCHFSLRKSQFFAARPQTPAYRNIHRLCHITCSAIAGEKLALSKGCVRDMQPIEQKTLDFIAEIDRVDDSDSVRLLFQRFLEVEIGFTNVVCLIPNASETLNSTIYFNTRPEPWTEHYVEANHIFSDPMVRELYKTYDPYAWSDVLNRRKLEREDLRIVQEAGEFGMREGFVVPIYQLNGYFGLVSAAGGKLELTERMRSVLQLTSIYVHDKVARLHRALREQKARLSPREIECLKWVSAGKSDWVIGEILHLSERTVNGYIESAKRKYEVTTRVQAVLLAARDGYINL
jgi:LuxR family quorum sensing-dependent transcriptional regulator